MENAEDYRWFAVVKNTASHPFQVGHLSGFHGGHDYFRTFVWMLFLQQGFNGWITAADGLQDQKKFLRGFNLPLPAVPGMNSRYNTDTGTQSVPHQAVCQPIRRIPSRDRGEYQAEFTPTAVHLPPLGVLRFPERGPVPLPLLPEYPRELRLPL